MIFSSGLAIALGTYMGGWRIIQTLGKRVSDIQTPQGFAAETGSAAVILTSSHLGFPLSTTQVATGSIFGAGAGRKLASVQWGIAGQIALAWLLTMPAAAAVGAVAAWVASTGIGTIIVALVLIGLAGGIYALAPPPGHGRQRQRGPRAAASRHGGLSEGLDMTIDWGALGVVTLVSFAVAILVVVLVSLALVGLSARDPAQEGELVSADETPIIGRGTRSLSPAAGTTVAVVCLLAAAAIVLYGLYVIVF